MLSFAGEGQRRADSARYYRKTGTKSSATEIRAKSSETNHIALIRGYLSVNLSVVTQATWREGPRATRELVACVTTI